MPATTKPKKPNQSPWPYPKPKGPKTSPTKATKGQKVWHQTNGKIQYQPQIPIKDLKHKPKCKEEFTPKELAAIHATLIERMKTPPEPRMAFVDPRPW